VKGELRALLKDAQLLGFTFDGWDGSGHIRLRSEQADVRYSVPATPSDRRGYRNSVAGLERLSGRKLPRPNSGKHRHRRQPRLDTTLSPTETEKSSEVDALVAEADSLRQRFAELAVTPTRDAAIEARRVLSRYEHLRRLLAQRHHIINPLIGGTP
jgi:hypothetical protein